MRKKWYEIADIEAGIELISKIDRCGIKSSYVRSLKKGLVGYLKYRAKGKDDKAAAAMEKIRAIFSTSLPNNVIFYDVDSFMKIQLQCQLVKELLIEKSKFINMWDGSNKVYYRENIMDSSRGLPFIDQLSEQQRVKAQDFDMVQDIFKRIYIKGSTEFEQQYLRLVKAFAEYNRHFGGPVRERIKTR